MYPIVKWVILFCCYQGHITDIPDGRIIFRDDSTCLAFHMEWKVIDEKEVDTFADKINKGVFILYNEEHNLTATVYVFWYDIRVNIRQGDVLVESAKLKQRAHQHDICNGLRKKEEF